jgi:hypothetical protein
MEPISCPEISVTNNHSRLRRIPKEHSSRLHYGGNLIHTKFFNNSRVCVYPRVNERIIMESTTNCFVHRGGTRRNFVNTWECDLILLITSWVSFVISHGAEQKKNVVSRLQPLLETNWLVPSLPLRPSPVAGVFWLACFHLFEFPTSGRPAPPLADVKSVFNLADHLESNFFNWLYFVSVSWKPPENRNFGFPELLLH